MTTACLYLAGKQPVDSDVLMSKVMNGDRSPAHSFTNINVLLRDWGWGQVVGWRAITGMVRDMVQFLSRGTAP